MSTSTFPEPETPDSELRDTGGDLDKAHDVAASDGPHLSASAEQKVSDDLGNLTGSE